MSCPEGIESTFHAARETGKPISFSEAPHPVASSREDLVGVALVAHIPDDRVSRGVEDRVKRYGQFDHTEAGSEMAARLRDNPEGFPPQFPRQMAELVLAHALQIVR